MLSQREEFQKRVETLANQVKQWAEPHEWVTKLYPKRIRDTDDQVYEVPALFLQKGPVRVLLDPIAYDVPGAEAAVDLYLMPTYDDLATLFFENGAWMIHYAFPPDRMATDPIIETKAMEFSEKTINQVLDAIADHAIPSV